jgi:hypothetical protein
MNIKFRFTSIIHGFLAYKIIVGLRSHPCWCFNASCRLFHGFLVVCPMFLLGVKVTIVTYDDHMAVTF